MSVKVYDRPKRDQTTRFRVIAYTVLFLVSIGLSIALYMQFTDETPQPPAPGPNTQAEVAKPAD